MIQRLVNRASFQISRIDPGVSYGDRWRDSNASQAARLRESWKSARLANIFKGGEVVAFEALSSNFAKRKAVSAPLFRTKTCNTADFDISGKQTFFVTVTADASSLLRLRETGSSFDRYNRLTDQAIVDVVTLDGFFENEASKRIDILKMDAQGAELKILKGAEGLLSAGNIGVIYTEVRFLRIYRGMALNHDIAAPLETHGYRWHNQYDLVHNQQSELALGNALFLKAAPVARP